MNQNTKNIATILIGNEIRKVVETLITSRKYNSNNEFLEKNLNELNAAYEDLMGIAHEKYIDYHSSKDQIWIIS
jgi:hypothetical protein